VRVETLLLLLETDGYSNVMNIKRLLETIEHLSREINFELPFNRILNIFAESFDRRKRRSASSK
jgi:hypothetical protein